MTTKEETMAYLRYRVIEEILDAHSGETTQLIKEAALKRHYEPSMQKYFTFSERTLYRYLKAYREFKFQGLKPNIPKHKGRRPAIPEEVLIKIINLKESLPTRSARRIIAMLELAGEVEKGQLKVRTINHKLNSLGYTYKRLTADNRVYQKNIAEHIFEQYQGDMMEGVYIKDENGNSFPVYLFGFIDHYSKVVPHSQFYPDATLPRMVDCLKKAISKHGCPTRLYLDNGRVYIADDFKLACAKLDIRISYATPYHPAGKGSIESFWKFVQSDFIAELKLHPVSDIRELNERYYAWLNMYHHKVHSSHDSTPLEAWDKQIADGIKPRWVSPIAIKEAFYHTDYRKVNKYGVVSFESNTYEVDATLVGEKVEVRYDPFDLRELFIYFKERFVCTAKPIDLTREKHSQYQHLNADPACDPKLSIDYLGLLSEQFQAGLKEQAQSLLTGNQELLNTKKANQIIVEDQSDHPVKVPKDKDYIMDRKEFLETVTDFLVIKIPSFTDKQKIYDFYDSFKDFDKDLFIKALNVIKQSNQDADRNIIYYLTKLRNEINILCKENKKL